MRKKSVPAAQCDLFAPSTTAWADAQLAELDLHPNHPHYDGAKQAALQGWPASRIRSLIWPSFGSGDR